MKKELIFSVFLICLVASSSLVFSIGTSTKSKESTDPIAKNCDSMDNLKERIKCRLQYKERYNEYAGEEESCSGLSDEQACISLYKVSGECYERSFANERIACFRAKTGIENAIDLQKSRIEDRRNYLVLLLYELQERVEEYVELGRISEDNAAEIIVKIVEIKQDILNKTTKEEIKSSLFELRALWETTLNE